MTKEKETKEEENSEIFLHLRLLSLLARAEPFCLRQSLNVVVLRKRSSLLSLLCKMRTLSQWAQHRRMSSAGRDMRKGRKKTRKMRKKKSSDRGFPRNGSQHTQEARAEWIKTLYPILCGCVVVVYIPPFERDPNERQGRLRKEGGKNLHHW